MKFLLPLLRNNLLQLSHANQLRYADTKNRTKTITLYMLIAAILMGLLAYLIYSLKIIYSIAWSLEEVVIELVVPMALICVMGECHPHYQAKPTSDFDSIDWSCSYLRNGIFVVEIFPKFFVYRELDCLCNHFTVVFSNGDVGRQKRSVFILQSLIKD